MNQRISPPPATPAYSTRLGADAAPASGFRERPGSSSFETIDRLARATLGRFTQGVSPHAQFAAWFEWSSHLARAPGRQMELWLAGLNASTRFARFALDLVTKDARGEVPFRPIEGDRRFEDKAWDSFPFVLWKQAFLAQEEWWQSAPPSSWDDA